MAYASVASLVRTIGSVLASWSPMESLIRDRREEFVAFHEKVSFLEVFLKNLEKNNNSGKMTDMEAQIKELATVGEHTIQLKLTQLFSSINDETENEKIRESLCDILKQVAEEFDNVQKESPKFLDKGKHTPQESLVQDSSSGTHTLSMVGRDDQRKRILVELTRYGGSSGELKVIPIVGMGGIGKTTLAKEVYNDASVQSHFDVRAWTTISQQHNQKEILLKLLRCTKGDDKFDMNDEAVLADMLQKSLKGKRYLIVLDDMWKSEAWDDLRLCFPSENKGSRILLTTRNTEVACSTGTADLSMQMSLMDVDESWKLFESIVFANEALPSEFETIGKKIVGECHGLPLTIVTVAGLLKSKRTIEYWENVARDVKSITNDPDNKCLDVLGLSYNHLTSDLKACLLYFGIFPEDSEISAKRLVRLWMAEGFLKLETDLEGEANKCLQQLVDRCLVVVVTRSLDETKIRSCKVHDLIYELCLRELTQSQDVFFMTDDTGPDEMWRVDTQMPKPRHFSHDRCCLSRPFKPRFGYLTQTQDGFFMTDDTGPDEMCRVEAQRSKHDHCCLSRPFKLRFGYSDGLYRALLTPEYLRKTDDDDYYRLNRTCSIFSSSFFHSKLTVLSDLRDFKLLRILDLTDGGGFYYFPRDILCLIWLRYLSMSVYFCIPPEISRLCNLQTFIVKGKSFSTPQLPEEIWGLMELRHLEVDNFSLQSPPRFDEEGFVLSNLHTLSLMHPTCCTKEVILRIRNVKKLGICGEYIKPVRESTLFDNLFHLHQLETLSFEILFPDVPLTIPSAKAFPSTLKKLKLINTCLSWEDLNIIGELSNLGVLKLKEDACSGEEWRPIEGGFAKLKTLQLVSNNLKYWKATNDNFPVLERLVIERCSDLEEIPLEFAEINSLQLIELVNCMAKLQASAKRIQQEQEHLGNKAVDVRIKGIELWRFLN